MKISEVKVSKKAYVDFMLLADEQEDMIDRISKEDMENI